MKKVTITVVSLDGLPESLKATAKEVEGGFQIEIDPADEVKGALVKERDARAAAEAAQKAAEEALEKVDPTEYQRLRAEEAERQEKLERAQGNVTAMQTRHKEQLQKVATERAEREAVLLKDIRTTRVRNAAVTALTTAGVSLDLLLPHVESHLRVTELEGDFALEVLDPATGEPGTNDEGKAWTTDDLLTHLRQQEGLKPAFATQSKGTGLPAGGKGGGGTLNPGDPRMWTDGENWKGIADGTVEL